MVGGHGIRPGDMVRVLERPDESYWLLEEKMKMAQKYLAIGAALLLAAGAWAPAAAAASLAGADAGILPGWIGWLILGLSLLLSLAGWVWYRRK